MGRFPKQLLQQQADAGFSLAALAGHDQHLLRLGRRDQKIAEIFLQGQNVLRDQQTVQKFQTLALCKDGVKILNYARGELVNTVALLEAMDSGKVRKSTPPESSSPRVTE